MGLGMICTGLLMGCSGQTAEPKPLTIEDIEALNPKQIWSINHAGDLYFSHLGYESVVLENGNIVFADRQLPAIVVFSDNGEYVKHVRSGRGPGEIQDAYFFTKDSAGNVYTYDQKNDKILTYNKEFDHVSDIIPKEYESNGILKVFPMDEENEYLLQMSSSEYLWDESKQRQINLVQFNSENNTFGEVLALNAQPYALLKIDGNVMGASKVPYAPGNIISYDFRNSSLFTYDTGSDLIAEINADFDTLNSIPLNLPTEEISTTELDSMEASYDMEEQWKAIKEALPEVKAPADKMIYNEGNFWLKSNIDAKTEMWLVVNEEGIVRNVVHLPKESMLTHIDDDHLGVRLNDVTFALFTNPVSETE